MADISNFDKIAGSVATGASAVGGVAGVLDGIFGWSAKRQERAQKRMMEKQQDQWKEQQEILAQQQLDQWNRENEYNDPTNYYKRLLAGADVNGISKASILGNTPGGSVGQSATGVSVPGSTGSGLGSVNSLGFGSAETLSNLRQRSEINNIDALTEKYKSESGLVDAQKTTETIRQRVFEQDIHESVARTNLTNLQSDFQKINNLTQGLRNDVEIKNIVSSTEKNFAQMYESVERGNLSKEERAVERKKLDVMQSEIALNYAYRLLTIANANMTDQQRKLLEESYSYQLQQIQSESELSAKQNEWYYVSSGAGAFNTILAGIGSALIGGSSLLRSLKLPKALKTGGR